MFNFAAFLTCPQYVSFSWSSLEQLLLAESDSLVIEHAVYEQLFNAFALSSSLNRVLILPETIPCLREGHFQGNMDLVGDVISPLCVSLPFPPPSSSALFSRRPSDSPYLGRCHPLTVLSMEALSENMAYREPSFLKRLFQRDHSLTNGEEYFFSMEEGEHASEEYIVSENIGASGRRVLITYADPCGMDAQSIEAALTPYRDLAVIQFRGDLRRCFKWRDVEDADDRRRIAAALPCLEPPSLAEDGCW